MYNEKDEDQISRILALRDAAAAATAAEGAAMQPELEKAAAEARADIPKRSTGSKIFILILLILVALGVIRGIQLYTESVDDEELALTNVKTQTVALGSVEVTSPLAGRVQAEDTINVIPMASGEVTAVYVDTGDWVSEGQLLFTIDKTQADIQYQQALINIQTLEDTIDSLQTNYDRTKALYDAGAAAKTDVESLETQLKSYQNQLEQAKLSADSAKDALSYYSVTAPASGYVTAVNVVAGGLAGQTQAAAVISDTSVLELSSNVSEYLINSVSVGQELDVYVSSASDQVFKGTITNIAEAPTQGTYTYPITVRIADPDGLIKAGMFAEIRLISARKENVIAVPSDAVITRDGETYAAVLDDKDTVTLKKVTVGVDNGTTAEITSGLTSGETLVIKGQDYVEDGETVHVVS